MILFQIPNFAALARWLREKKKEPIAIWSAIKKEEERSLLAWNESGRTTNNNGRYVIDMGSTVMYIGQAIAKGSGILREGSIV